MTRRQSPLNRFRLPALVSLATMVLASLVAAQANVARRPVNIFSDGTRLAGDIFYPENRNPEEKLPTILLCHGWGGVKSHLNRTYAPKFAAAGYMVLTFDYRGWGESDSRLVIVGDQPETDENGEALVRVRAIREVVDPVDQLEDIQAALDFLEGEPGVDTERIGIWGSSFGGGLVISTAANDSRVKVVVSQVGAMNGHWVLDAIGEDGLRQRAVERARGERSPVPQGEDVRAGLRGTPYVTKFAKYSAMDHVEKLNVPTLFIDAENEELFDRREHAFAVYERIKDRVTSEYHLEPGIQHYGIYQERYPAASDKALAWFDEQLKTLGQDRPPAELEAAHFHHVHLNVQDPAATRAFYVKYFGANEVSYRGVSDALFTEKSFILMNQVDTAPPSNLGTSLWHIGWAGVDGQSEFDWRVNAGIDVQTPITPLGSNFYMYFWGPDREVIEVYTGSKNHRFEHVHLLATDVNATVGWFLDNLELSTRFRTVPRRPVRWMNTIRIDNVNLIVFGVPQPGEERPPWFPEAMKEEFVPTENTAIDHFAFSFRDIAPIYERMVGSGVEIVRPITEDGETGLTSFFVRGPDKLLVEIVEEKPVPEGIWR